MRNILFMMVFFSTIVFSNTIHKTVSCYNYGKLVFLNTKVLKYNIADHMCTIVHGKDFETKIYKTTFPIKKIDCIVTTINK